eukprot:6308-Heterococcus_DN1.PRE.2
MHCTESVTLAVVKSVNPYLGHAVVNDVVVASKRITCHNAPTTMLLRNGLLITITTAAPVDHAWCTHTAQHMIEAPGGLNKNEAVAPVQSDMRYRAMLQSVTYVHMKCMRTHSSIAKRPSSHRHSCFSDMLGDPPLANAYVARVIAPAPAQRIVEKVGVVIRIAFSIFTEPSIQLQTIR